MAICHIPKCAGTSLREQLLKIIPDMYGGTKYHVDSSLKPSTRIFSKKHELDLGNPHRSELFWTRKELHQALQDYSVVMGHIAVSHFEKVGAKKIIVIVREPRVRALSQFLYWHSLPESFFDKYTKNSNLIPSLLQDSQLYFSSRQSDVNQISEMSRSLIYSKLFVKPEVNYYWGDDNQYLIKKEFGVEVRSEIPKLNVTVNATKLAISQNALLIMEQKARKEQSLLEKLMDRGMLSFRSVKDLDQEYQDYLDSKFTIV